MAASAILVRVRVLAAEGDGRSNTSVPLLRRLDATAAVYTLAIGALDTAVLVQIAAGNNSDGRGNDVLSVALGLAWLVAWLVACLTIGFRRTPWTIRLTTVVLVIMLVVSFQFLVGHDAADALLSLSLFAAVEVVLVLVGRALRWVVCATRKKD